MGYAFFVIVGTIVGAVVAFPLGAVLALLLSPVISRVSFRTMRIISGIIGGVVWGVGYFFLAWLTYRFFQVSIPVICAIGAGLMIFAAPKVQNALYAVPSGIILFVLLASFLI